MRVKTRAQGPRAGDFSTDSSYNKDALNNNQSEAYQQASLLSMLAALACSSPV
jgi:hypothetical protein